MDEDVRHLKAAAMVGALDALLAKMREYGYEGAEWDELAEALHCARDWLTERYPIVDEG